MTDFLEMHIFFAVTTVVVVLIGGLLCIGLWRLNRILEQAERIARTAAMEGELIRQDIAELRRDFRAGKGRLESFLGFTKKITARRRKKD